MVLGTSYGKSVSIFVDSSLGDHTSKNRCSGGTYSALLKSKESRCAGAVCARWMYASCRSSAGNVHSSACFSTSCRTTLITSARSESCSTLENCIVPLSSPVDIYVHLGQRKLQICDINSIWLDICSFIRSFGDFRVFWLKPNTGQLADSDLSWLRTNSRSEGLFDPSIFLWIFVIPYVV